MLACAHRRMAAHMQAKPKQTPVEQQSRVVSGLGDVVGWQAGTHFACQGPWLHCRGVGWARRDRLVFGGVGCLTASLGVCLHLVGALTRRAAGIGLWAAAEAVCLPACVQHCQATGCGQRAPAVEPCACGSDAPHAQAAGNGLLRDGLHVDTGTGHTHRKGVCWWRVWCVIRWAAGMCRWHAGLTCS